MSAQRMLAERVGSQFTQGSLLTHGKGRLLVAVALYVVTTAVYLALAAHDTLVRHTPYNHFALLAQAWLDGHLDLGAMPPRYAQGNDFASFHGRWFVAFPPLPALLILPLVWLAGSPERVQDGQFFIWLAGIAPALVFLALEKLRRHGLSERSPAENLLLSLLFAFGTVYFFTAEQGTVWFAAHVVGCACIAAYLLFALGAERPLLAGLALALGFAARTPLLFAFPLFVAEAFRRSLRTSSSDAAPSGAWIRQLLGRLDARAFARRCVVFALPVALVIALTLWHNHARFGDAFESGYRFLAVRWQQRMQTWGLFSYHYLAKNLGVVLTSLPWYNAPGSELPLIQVNGHGLALWVTTPAFLWLIWPKRVGYAGWALYLTALFVALPDLLYQNTGWLQFGYRFSNDFAIFLIALLAVTSHRFGRTFLLLTAWAVGVNAFGAVTFNREAYDPIYFVDGTQRVLYQPD